MNATKDNNNPLIFQGNHYHLKQSRNEYDNYRQLTVIIEVLLMKLSDYRIVDDDIIQIKCMVLGFKEELSNESNNDSVGTVDCFLNDNLAQYVGDQSDNSLVDNDSLFKVRSRTRHNNKKEASQICKLENHKKGPSNVAASLLMMHSNNSSEAEDDKFEDDRKMPAATLMTTSVSLAESPFDERTLHSNKRKSKPAERGRDYACRQIAHPMGYEQSGLHVNNERGDTRIIEEGIGDSDNWAPGDSIAVARMAPKESDLERDSIDDQGSDENNETTAYANRILRKMQDTQTNNKKNSKRKNAPESDCASRQNSHQNRQNVNNERDDIKITEEEIGESDSRAPGDSMAVARLAPKESDLEGDNIDNQGGDENNETSTYANRISRKMQDAQTANNENHEMMNTPSLPSRESCATNLPSKNSGQNCERDDEEGRPGAYSAQGRALGAYPNFRRANTGATSTTLSNNAESTETAADISTPEIVAFTVDDDDVRSSMRLSIVEQSVRQHIIDESVHASVVEPVDDASNDKMIRRAIWLVLVMVVMAVVVGLSVVLTMDHSDPSPSVAIASSESPTTSPTENPRPVLDTLLEEGVLRCGIGWEGIGYRISEDGKTYEGFEVDLCYAVAAALFNDTNPDRVEITVIEWVERWEALANRSIDLVTLASTHTMERDVYEVTAESGFSFTSPYLYDGFAFGGIPPFVDCADKLDVHFGGCRGTRICVAEGTSTVAIVKDLLPDIAIRIVSSDSFYQSLIDGTCNVIAEGTFTITKSMVEQAGYNGSYAIGENLFAKQPLCMVTRDDDPQWSDFVNYVLQSLLSAEAQGITQETSYHFMTTNSFGVPFEYMFINAIKAVGNYAEFYARNIETKVPRKGLNLLNIKGDSGLIYSHPFGSNFHDGPEPNDGGTLQRIVERGYLRCGIINRTGFGELNLTTKVWSGLGADYCRALSASIFSNRVDNATLFVDLSGTDELYMALSNGTVDVLSVGSLNIVTDVREQTSGEGFTFSQPYFYGPLDEDLLLALATRQDDPQWSDFVYFVVTSTFYAEENAITGTNRSSADMPEVKIFGPAFKNMFRNAILAVGNYGEMYARNVEQLYPRNGTRNELNLNPFGAQLYPLPLDKTPYA